MSTRLERLQALVDRGATPGERAAAARALAVHQAKQPAKVQPPLVEPKPVGPDLMRRGGPFAARKFDGIVWVAVREAWADITDARQWIEDRRQMKVRVGGCLFRMIPTAVEVDDERQQVHVTADVADLEPWS